MATQEKVMFKMTKSLVFPKYHFGKGGDLRKRVMSQHAGWSQKKRNKQQNS